MNYFSDTFATTKGWTLDTNWAIGSAMASTSCSSGGQDPATDHSGDGKIAGVVLGGCYPMTISSIDLCMTSPSINASTASTLHLSYWRHLHTDYPSYVYSKVDVSSNGSTWTSVYSVPSGGGVNDASWTQQKFDVSAYKSSTFKVRFCYRVASSSAYSGGGWNVDDVVVSNSASCTTP